MSSLGSIAVGAAPLAGGLLFGAAATARPAGISDLRALIRLDLEILARLPEDDAVRRAEVQRLISDQLDALIAANDKSRRLRGWARYWTERGHWRDLVLVITAVLFAVVAWYGLDHDRRFWLLLFLCSVLMAVATAILTMRGFLRSVRSSASRNERDPRP